VGKTVRRVLPTVLVVSLLTVMRIGVGRSDAADNEETASAIASQATSRRAVALDLLRSLITADDPHITPEMGGDYIRLAGDMRLADLPLIDYLAPRWRFVARSDGVVFAHTREEAEAAQPVPRFMRQCGLPALPALTELASEPFDQSKSYFISQSFQTAALLTSLLGNHASWWFGDCVSRQLASEREQALQRAAAEVPDRYVLAYHELAEMPLTPPEDYQTHDDPDALREAVMSQDVAVRHAALCGVLAERRQAIAALAAAVEAKGLDAIDAIEALGELRPMQREATDALLGCLTGDALRATRYPERRTALINALAHIGLPALHACTTHIAETDSANERRICAAVIAAALGPHARDWLTTEAQRTVVEERRARFELTLAQCDDLFDATPLWLNDGTHWVLSPRL